jgi:raffinose/stachyose/melibiose transport system permease protein
VGRDDPGLHDAQHTLVAEGTRATARWTLYTWTATRFLIWFLVFLSILGPLYYLVSTALKTKREFSKNLWGLPIAPTLQNFADAFSQGKIFQWFANSIILTACSVILLLVVSSLAAYAFSRMDFPRKQAVFAVLISLMAIPAITLVTPLYVVMSDLDLIDTYPAPILIYVGLLLPFSIYLLTGFFRTIPQEIIDSATIDGCNDLRILWNVIMPIAKPGLLTLGVVNSLTVWNELLIALVFLQSKEMRTLTVGIAFFRERYYVNEPLMMAGLLIVALPMLVLYMGAQRQFASGLVTGALKG